MNVTAPLVELKSIGVALMREGPLRVIAESSSSLSLFFSVYIYPLESLNFNKRSKLLFCVCMLNNILRDY